MSYIGNRRWLGISLAVAIDELDLANTRDIGIALRRVASDFDLADARHTGHNGFGSSRLDIALPDTRKRPWVAESR